MIQMWVKLGNYSVIEDNTSQQSSWKPENTLNAIALERIVRWNRHETENSETNIRPLYPQNVFSYFPFQEREKDRQNAHQRSHENGPEKTTLTTEDSVPPKGMHLPGGPSPIVITTFAASNPYSVSAIDCQKLEPGMIPIGSGPSEGDALTESRRYWAAIGYDFPAVFPLDQANRRTGANLQPAPPPVSLPGVKTTELRVPEAVLQALTCRPVTDFASSTAKPPPISAPPPQSPVPTPSSVPLATGFVPRSVQRKRQPDHRPVIRVGELKRLALMLGPAQGPSALPDHELPSGALSFPNPSTSSSAEPVDSQPTPKRLVFHRPLNPRPH